jgi:hypothetical protein
MISLSFCFTLQQRSFLLLFFESHFPQFIVLSQLFPALKAVRLDDLDVIPENAHCVFFLRPSPSSFPSLSAFAGRGNDAKIFVIPQVSEGFKTLIQSIPNLKCTIVPFELSFGFYDFDMINFHFPRCLRDSLMV